MEVSFTKQWRGVVIAAITITIATFTMVVIILVIEQISIGNLNSEMAILKQTIAGENNASVVAELCTVPNRVNVYTQLVNSGNYCVQSTSFSVTGAKVQLAGSAAVVLCEVGGTGKVPVYSYISATGDPITNSFGTSPVAPSGFNLGNSGNVLGYVFAGQYVSNTTLNPIYLVSASFNSGSQATLMSYESSPVFGIYLIIIMLTKIRYCELPTSFERSCNWLWFLKLPLFITTTEIHIELDIRLFCCQCCCRFFHYFSF